MGLRFSDALRLSWSNVVEHKKRSAVIVLTISLLFGVVMGFNFITSGMERTTIAAAAGQTGGEVYIEAWYRQGAEGSWGETIYSKEEAEKADLTPVLNELEDQKVRGRVAEYGGEVVGYYWYYQLDHAYQVISKTAVEQFIDAELWESLPEDKIPVIIPEGWEPPIYGGDTGFHDRIVDTVYRVGSIPGTEEGSPTLDGFNPLNVILAQLPSAVNDEFWIVDDGSGTVERFIRDQLGKYLAEKEVAWYRTGQVRKKIVAKFSDPYRVSEYAGLDEETFGEGFYTAGYHYGAQDIFGTTVAVTRAFNYVRFLLVAAEVILLIVAVIIAVMTFAHLIDSDAATVALYRAMGASTDGIYVIYLLYLVELCLLAIVATMVIAMMFVGGMALTSAEALAIRLQGFYNLSQLPKVTFYLFNKTFWSILGMILAVALFSLFFTLRRFSPKHIAKKLKED